MPTFYDRFVNASNAGRNIASKSSDLMESKVTAMPIYAAWRNRLRRGCSTEMEAGTRVANLPDNHPRWVAAYLGIIAAGGTTVPLDTAYHADQVAKLLRDSGATLLICDRTT